MFRCFLIRTQIKCFHEWHFYLYFCFFTAFLPLSSLTKAVCLCTALTQTWACGWCRFPLQPDLITSEMWETGAGSWETCRQHQQRKWKEAAAASGNIAWDRVTLSMVQQKLKLCWQVVFPILPSACWGLWGHPFMGKVQQIWVDFSQMTALSKPKFLGSEKSEPCVVPLERINGGDGGMLQEVTPSSRVALEKIARPYVRLKIWGTQFVAVRFMAFKVLLHFCWWAEYHQSSY